MEDTTTGVSTGPKAFGYRRVSTGDLARKYSLPAQRAEIERYGAEQGLQGVAWFEERNRGRKRVEREGLMERVDRAKGEGVFLNA